VTIFILMGIFFLTLIMGIPVAFAVGLAALGAVIYAEIPVFVVFQRMFGGVDSFSLLAIPFFVFMGNIMDTGGIARRIVGFANIIIGQIRGGAPRATCLPACSSPASRAPPWPTRPPSGPC